MRTRKIITMSLILVSLLIINGCGGKKYADAQKLMEDQADVMEKFASELDKATDAAAVAKAMNNFADSMEKLAPKIKKLQEKYPELKNSQNPPAELAETAKKIEEKAMSFTSSLMKIGPYMQDSEVQKAQIRMSDAMTIK